MHRSPIRFDSSLLHSYLPEESGEEHPSSVASISTFNEGVVGHHIRVKPQQNADIIVQPNAGKRSRLGTKTWISFRIMKPIGGAEEKRNINLAHANTV